MFATTALAGLGGALGAIALSPGAALAQCTPPAGTTGPGAPVATAASSAACVAPTPGIAYQETGPNLTVTLTGTGNVTPHGVFIEDNANAANLTFTVDNSAAAGPGIDATTAGEDGIEVSSTGGAVTISTGNNSAAFAGSAVTGDADGIFAVTTGTGAVVITADGNVTGVNDNGIEVSQTGSGNTTITTFGAVKAGGNGVFSETGTGNFTGTFNGAVSGVEGIALERFGGGAINVTVAGNVTGVDTGIFQETVDGANTLHVTNGAVVTGASDDEAVAVEATGLGGVSVTTDTGTDLEASGGGSAHGIFAKTFTGNVSVVSNGTIGALAPVTAYGILAENGNATGPGANGTLSVTAGGAIKAAESGIGAFNFNSGSGAAVGNSTVNAINVVTTAPIQAGSVGIDAEVDSFNGANNDNININVGGNVVSGNQGVFAQTNGGGNINIVTQPGALITSTNNDGIDAFALGGGNVFVHLLDGGINSNTTGAGPAGVTCSNCSAPPAAGFFDPNGVHLTANMTGTVTFITDDFVNNQGPGDGILTSTVDGANSVTVNANITNTLGSGVVALATGNGTATVNLGNVTKTAGNVTTNQIFSVSTTGGNGVVAENTFVTGNQTATVNVTAPGNVTVTNGASGIVGIAAETSASGSGSRASVVMTGAAGGTISVEGAGSNDGVFAEATHGGSASVTTNAGRTVTVGLNGGNFDSGVSVFSFGAGPATVTLGANNTITVGNLSSIDSQGVRASADLGPAVVIAGDGESITVNGNNTIGNNSLGVVAVSDSGNATVMVGNATTGSGIRVIDLGTNASSIAVSAFSPLGNATVAIGTTSVSNTNGVAIQAATFGSAAAASVTTFGNASSTNDSAILTDSDGGATTINVNGGVTKGLGMVVANVSIPVIQFNQFAANTTTTIGIGAAGTVESNTASLTGLAIASGNASLGSVVVNDVGHLIGDVDFSNLVGNGTVGNISNTTVNVTGGGVWLTSGTSKFGNGALGAGNATVASDTVTTGGPGGNGLIQTVGATTFVFGTTTKNSYTNVGTTQVGSNGAPSTFTLTGGPIVLANAGVIDLSTGVVGTDALTGLTTVFVGVAGGQIATKAQLGGVGSIASVL
ncbi:MAG TPA: hypothetical protein VGL73_13895, partial [Caulobacteraceae bacterium]